MAFTGKTPWHGLGQNIDPNASIYEWVQAAGLNWSIERSPVQYMNGEMHTMTGRDVLYRSDNNEALSVVSSRYQIVQPYDVLEFFRDLVETKGFQIETAGSLFGGSRIWALARINRDEVIKDGDKVSGYLLLSTSCDGGLATSAQFTSVRVVCNNTLRMANHDTDQKGFTKISIPHSTKFDPVAVKIALGVADKRFDTFISEGRKLAEKMISDDAKDDFLKLLLKDTTDAQDISKTKAYQTINNLYNGAAWGLLNAVTQYVDHEKPAKSTDYRLDAAWYGSGAKLKDRAFELALAMPAKKFF
jgi:phage/plasmid-like protein (TIGR03299 family)